MCIKLGGGRTCMVFVHFKTVIRPTMFVSGDPTYIGSIHGSGNHDDRVVGTLLVRWC